MVMVNSQRSSTWAGPGSAPHLLSASSEQHAAGLALCLKETAPMHEQWVLQLLDVIWKLQMFITTGKEEEWKIE